MALKETANFARRSIDGSAGARVRHVRETVGLSRKDLAKAAGIGDRTLARIERGDQIPREETLRAVAEAFGIPLDLLAPGWEEDESARITSGSTHIGIGLRVLRKNAGVTIAHAAAAVGVSSSTLSRFERGFHGEGTLAQLVQREEWLSDRLVFRSSALAAVIGFDSADTLTTACEAVELDRG